MSCLSELSLRGLLGPLLSYSESSLMLVAVGLAVGAWLGFRALRHRVRLEHESALGNSPLDPDLLREAKPWIARLVEFGFRESTAWRNGELLEEEKIVWRFVNRDWKCMAVLRGFDRIDTGARPAFTLSFHSFLEDGRYLVTAEPGRDLAVPADWDLVERRFSEIASQWREHQERVAAAGSPARLPADPCAAVRDRDMDAIQAAVAAGQLKSVRRGSGMYRATLRGIPGMMLRLALRMIPGRGPRTGRRDLAAPDPAGNGELVDRRQVSADRMAERDVRRYRNAAGWGRFLSLIGLLGLAGAVYLSCRVFTGLSHRQAELTALAILVVHQLGHWLPMKLFGFKGGALTILRGEMSNGKPGAPLWQHMVVLLGGPVPGIVAGLAMLAYGHMDPAIPDFWLNVGVMAIAINGVGLLPFRPFDGARVLDLLVFGNRPLLRLLFTALMVAGAAVGAVVTGWPALGWLVAGLTLSGLLDAGHLIMVKSARKVHWHTQGGEEVALFRIFRERREKGDHAFVGSPFWRVRTRAMLAKVMRHPSGWMSRLGAGWIYATACLVPLVALLGAVATLLGGESLPWLRQQVQLVEFQRQIPQEALRELDDDRLAALRELDGQTVDWVGAARAEGREPISREMWDELCDEMGRAVDYLDWQEAAIARKSGEIDTPWIWLEIARLRLEEATGAGRWDEALRRADLLLHAVAQLRSVERADRLRDVQQAERWGLSVVAASFGKVPQTDADLSRIRDRIALLRRPAVPEREAFLLVEGWSAMRAPELEEARASIGRPRSFGSEAALVRDCYLRGESLWKIIGDWGRGGDATSAVARHWIVKRNTGRLPVRLPDGIHCDEAEADYIRDYCRRRDRLEWLRVAVLAAIRLELFESDKGMLPSQWKHEIEGGAVLELVAGEAPVLTLVETQAALDLRDREWMPGEPDDKPFRLEIPLGRLKPKSAVVAGQ